jgi:hypothetical protein
MIQPSIIFKQKINLFTHSKYLLPRKQSHTQKLKPIFEFTHYHQLRTSTLSSLFTTNLIKLTANPNIHYKIWRWETSTRFNNLKWKVRCRNNSRQLHPTVLVTLIKNSHQCVYILSQVIIFFSMFLNIVSI